MTAAVADAAPSRWDDALTVAQLFAVDPAGLGGVALLAGSGTAQARWLDALQGMLPKGAPVRRLPLSISDDRLLGGVDLTATLRAGRAVLQRGLLAEADGGVIVIPSAERLDAAVAARLASVLDLREVRLEREALAARIATRVGIVAFDEGLTPEERVPPLLLERLAFHLDLRRISAREATRPVQPASVAAARACLATVRTARDDILEALVATAAACGIDSVTAPLMALRAARAAAALAGRDDVGRDDVLLAARLVLGPRAQPQAEDRPEDKPAAAQSEPDHNLPMSPDTVDRLPPDDTRRTPAEADDLSDIMVAAVRSALPDGLLVAGHAGPMAPRSPPRRQANGRPQLSFIRGRRVGVSTGPIRPGGRLALVDTLRAAAPWQAPRRKDASTQTPHGRMILRKEDFRTLRFAQRQESTIVFCVDASGSTAFHRLAEAKGAVELLLGQAYAARTYAALVVFRGKRADLLLPPTRSLSRAKTLLANLPGGGGTPLASGLQVALLTAVSERAKGRDPLVIILTDGRANVARDGVAAAVRPMQDALAAGRMLRAQRIAAVLVDTSPRSSRAAADLAAAMDARYVALPYASAAAVRDIAAAAMPVRSASAGAAS
jgi:magnesium chelatase subunit D